jgi:hypothetical protein
VYRDRSVDRLAVGWLEVSFVCLWRTIRNEAYTDGVYRLGGETNMSLLEWLWNLPADFAFLLALPFVVAGAGFLGDWVRCRRSLRRK